MTGRSAKLSIATLILPPSDHFGSIELGLEGDESGQPHCLDIRYRFVLSSPPSEISLLRLALEAADAIRWQVPRVEPYLGDRICRACDDWIYRGRGLCGSCRTERGIDTRKSVEEL
jgi:hypothetical protein